jgi:imidazolonepropionase-like amidohydrolase
MQSTYMKRYFFLLAGCFLFSCTDNKNSASTDKNSSSILIQNINIIDIEEQKILQEQDVLIQDNRITEIVKHNTKELHAGTIINGEGKFLIPGLWDMHSHPLSERDLLLMLVHGVTGTRIMDGDTNTLRWKQKTDKGQLAGPKIYTAGETFEGSPDEQNKKLVLSLEGWEVTDNRKDAIAAVQRHKAMGYDFIKIYNNLRDSVVEAIFEEAKRQQLDVCGHVPGESGLVKCVKLGMKSVEHLRGYIQEVVADNANVKPGVDFRSRTLAWNYIDSTKVNQMIDFTVASKLWNCPTFTFELILKPKEEIKQYLTTPEAEYLLGKDLIYFNGRDTIPWASNFSEGDFKNTIPSLGNRFDFVRRLHLKGGLLLAGSDADVYGLSLHRELQNFAACGLSNYEVLKTATINAAKYFGIDKDYGTVEKNKIADLVILDMNPIENITSTQSIFAVIRNGKLISNEQINKIKEELKTETGKTRFKMRR